MAEQGTTEQTERAQGDDERDAEARVSAAVAAALRAIGLGSEG